ncbi:amidase family protein, partial [Helcobacillus massiliensis]|uniref:amidase family protein n=1 Tax=Helcobacillus massiliensis TaxID=521392 RepID=UPI0021A4B788
MTDLIRKSAAEMAAGLAAGEFSARELTDAHLERIEAVDSDLNAFITVTADDARATADAVDSARAAGKQLEPLAGVPVAVKDIAVTRGVQTTAGSTMLEGWVPPYDATLVTHLKQARLPILGKTNMDEFAMGSSTETSAYGITRNPWNLDRIPGGARGGAPPPPPRGRGG